jgi:formylglycine-generating enzyme required for sulfatase activity
VLAIARPAALAVALAVALLGPALAGAACPEGMRRLAGGAFRDADGVETAVPAFCMDVTEVTVAAYARCVGAGACHAEDLECGPAATWHQPGATNHPVNCVSWFEADAFCRAHGKRLPTEPEWEWAARGGPRASTYPWGEAAPSARACWDGDGNAKGKGERKATCAVGAHPKSRSPDGLQDLAGNVREWTATEVERFRVLRGGSWGDSLPEFLSAGFRGWNAPDERMELIGFRCAAAVGTKALTPRRQVAKARAELRDDGVLVMPRAVDPSRR